MIVTLTPNPSLDRTLEVTELRRGAVLRATRVLVQPGGKGINVARALQANGVRTRAVVPLGGHEGDQLLDTLRAQGLDVVAVTTAGAVRTNVSVVEPDGVVTKINAPGHPLGRDEVAALTKATVAAIEGADWVAGCGSLPPGTADGFYAELTRSAHHAGARVAIDTSGPALRAALAAGPDLIKPNAEELAQVTGRAVETLGDAVQAADELRELGAGTVVVSFGADGAVLVDAAGTWHATTPPITPRSAVGAGDALVAGLLASPRLDADALRRGVAFGTAAALLPGTQLPGPDDLDLASVALHAVDPDRRLREPGGPR
ncbi:1-phosphofructokinase [Egicoccus sp. AB-alg2]|uniref:1-phosphofructokinase n=1 Tax=Egicoccus sp. AB-alg2 TaxID=3242693 RepID=UPI00359EF28B